jgi:Protein of unknown function (DUF3108)
MKTRHFSLGLACLLALTGPALAAGGVGAESAGPASQFQMAMTIYAGGITLGKMDIDATVRGSDYHAVSNLETSGVVNAFWQAEIQATSSGKVSPKNLTPVLYDSFDINRTGKKQEVSLTYDSANPPRLYADPAYSTTGYEVKPEDQKATLDPLSAVMFIVSGAGTAGTPCTVTAPVFDGRRRYNIEMSKVKDVDIKMDNGLYAGHAALCQIKYHQLSGFKPRVLKSNESFPTINAWVVTYPSQIKGSDYVVPLRVWADTPYGMVSVVANSLKIDGQAPKAN